MYYRLVCPHIATHSAHGRDRDGAWLPSCSKPRRLVLQHERRPRSAWPEDRHWPTSPVAVLRRKRREEGDEDGSRRTWSGSGPKGVDLSAADRREPSTPYSGLLRVAPRRLSERTSGGP